MKRLIIILLAASIASCTDRGYDIDGVATYDTIPRNDMGTDSSKIIVKR